MRTTILLAAIASLVCLSCRARRVKPAPPPKLAAQFPLVTAGDAELCARLVAMSAPPPVDGIARRKAIVGDLHLGPGTRSGRRFHGLEDFFADAIFARLLKRLEGMPTELIIAGDFIDFWQIEGAMGLLPPREEGEETILGADQAGSLAALDVALAAHPEVFDALRRFLASGDHRIVFIAGNHDADLRWPRVQLALASAVGARDRTQVAFVADSYVDRGVHVEHGHRLDAANTTPIEAAGGAPVALDRSGRCRLQSSWGHVFVAAFFNQLEQRFPFVDNLYPESAALIWGLREEPDVTESALAGARFADMLLSAQSGRFNLSALRAAVMGLAGGTDRRAGSGRLAGIWDELPASETFWNAVGALASDPNFGGLRDSLIDAAKALPDVDAATDALAKIDTSALQRLRRRVAVDPMQTAAADLLAADPSLRAVVFAHTHVPGGTVARAGGGHYANTGTWAPIAKISELKAKNVAWTELSLEDPAQFPQRFPVVVIDYNGAQPQPPHILHAQ